MHIKVCKEELAWVIDKQLQVIYAAKELKNKAKNNIVCIALWPLLMYSSKIMSVNS